MTIGKTPTTGSNGVKAAAAIFALVVMAMSGGCGKAIKYDFPVGKTLVYRVTRQVGRVKETGETVYPKNKTEFDLKLRTRQHLRRRYSILAVATPPVEKIDGSLFKKLGELDVRVDNKGIVQEAFGMGIPIELRLVLPELPARRVRRGRTWKQRISSNYMGKPVELDLISKYVGMEKIMKRRCAHVRGTSTYALEDDVENPARNISMHLSLNLAYEEDIYVDLARGYMLKAVVVETRTREFTDKNTGEVGKIIDTRRTVAEMVRIE